MNVLSLFDGISVAQHALRDRNITNYYASEINQHAIHLTKTNFKYTHQLGSVVDLKPPKYVDLLVGGSPCQGFSFAGKELNFKDERSKLFFEYVRILQECKPSYFLLENVVMKKEYQDVISEHLGVEPYFIDSKDFCPQQRKRLYWTNIPIEKHSVNDKKFVSSDDYTITGRMVGRRINEVGKREDCNKKLNIQQYIECRIDGKTNCLTTVDKDNVLVKQFFNERKLKTEVDFRFLTVEEYEKLQTLPAGYTKGVSKNTAKKNYWEIVLQQ